MLLQPKAGAQVCKGVLHPLAAQCAQQKHLVKALLRRELCGILGIGVVLDVG